MSVQKDKRIQRSKSAMKDALLLLLQEKNIVDITVSNIIDKAGYSRRTFYAHYKGKEDFLCSIIDEVIEGQVAVYISTYEENRHLPIMDIHKKTSLSFFEYVYAHRKLYELLLCDGIMTHTAEYMCDLLCVSLPKKLEISYDPSYNLELNFYVKAYHYLSMVKFWIKNRFKFSPQYMSELDQRYQVPIFQGVKINKTHK